MVELTFKTLQQRTFKLEAELSDKISDLKTKIHQKEGDAFSPELQKIIYGGQILSDDKTVEELNVKKTDFFVVMVSKPKAQPSKPATPSTTSTSNTPAATSTTESAPAAATSSTPSTTTPAPSTEQSAAATTTATTTATPAADSGPSDGSSAFLTGPALENAINEMVSMGFPKEQVQKALRASFNNPDRAVDYLMNGIPEGLDAEPAPTTSNTGSTPASAPAPTSTNTNTNTTTSATQQQQNTGNLFEQAAAAASQESRQPQPQPEEGDAAELERLSRDPRLQSLRQVIAQSPDLLQSAIQELAQQDPRLIGVISRNPTAFRNILLGGAAGAGAGAGLGEDFEGFEGGAPGQQVIEITQEERDSIEQLTSMGFPQEVALQAFIACERNVELAAAYLLEHGTELLEDDDEVPGSNQQ